MTTTSTTRTPPADLRSVAGSPELTSLLAGPLRATTIGAVALVSALAFEAMAVATAMPAVAADLDGLGLYGLVFGGSLAASVVGMVASGIDADRRGPSRAFTAGATLFLAGLALATIAPTMAALVVGRAVQGLGIGLTIVTLYLLVDLYPDHLQARMFAAFSAAWVVPALVGPAIAGALVEHVHWRAVFGGVALVALPAVLLVRPRMRAIPGGGEARWSPTDLRRIAAALAASLGVGALHLTGQRGDVVGRVVLVVALAVTFVAARSLLPRQTLQLGRGLPTVIAMRGLGGAAFIAAEVLVPLLLTTTRGLSTTEAGIVLTGGALGWAAGSWAQGRWPAAPTRWAGLGLSTLAVGIAGMAAVLAPAVPVAVGAIGWALAGAGMGMLYPTLSVQVLRLSTTADQGSNVSSLQVADAVASSAALAATGTLVALGGTTTTVFALGLGLAGLLAVAAALATPRLTPSPP